MKKLIIVMLLMWGMSANAAVKSAMLTASGLTCSMCSKSIFKALEKVPSIKSIEPDVEKSTFAIQFKEGAVVSLDDVKNAVEKAGFSVASLVATVSFNGEEVANDVHIVNSGITFHFLDVKKRKLVGDVAITVVDKNFLPKQDYKKYAKFTNGMCFKTGEKAACCPKDASSSKRVYHVTI